jgi:hypothetical protein
MDPTDNSNPVRSRRRRNGVPVSEQSNRQDELPLDRRNESRVDSTSAGEQEPENARRSMRSSEPGQRRDAPDRVPTGAVSTTLTAVHKAVAQVGGTLSIALARRRLPNRSVTEEWAAQLERAARDLRSINVEKTK